MKKALLVFLFFIFLTLPVSASVESEIEDIKGTYDPSGEISAATEGGLNELFSLIGEKVLSYKNILKNAAYLCGVAVFTAFSKGFAGKGASGKAVDFASSAAVVSLTLIPAVEAVREISGFLKTVSGFLTAFAPVYAGISSASGQVISGANSAYFILALSSVISAITGAAIIPMLSVYLCLSSVSGVFAGVDIAPFCEGMKKIVNIILGFFSAVFTGFLTFKTSVSAASDSVAMRGIKFAAGSFFPVVGGALSEAVTTAGGYLGVIKSSFGFFGIAVLALAFLPTAINILLWIISLWISNSAAAALGEQGMVRSTKALLSAFSLLWSISATFFLLSVISIGVTLGG